MGEHLWCLASRPHSNKGRGEGNLGRPRNGINPRDAELLKRAMMILRHFHSFLSAPRLDHAGNV